MRVKRAARIELSMRESGVEEEDLEKSLIL